MTKAILAILVAALAAAVVVLPEPPAREPDLAAAVDPPSVAVCPVEEGSGRSTTIGILSTINGEGRFTAFAGGAPVGSTSFATGASASTSIPVIDVAAVGLAAGLVELPNADAAAASVIVGEQSAAVESCLTTPSQQTLLAGGSTLSGQTFEIQMMNPYAGEALVDLTVWSESGIESSSRLLDVAVPSRSTVVVNLTEIIPGRESLAVAIDTTRGSAMAVGRLSAGDDSALWSAVAPGQDWFIPIPSGGLGEVVISTGLATDVEYEVDVYGADGLIEAFEEGVVPGRGLAVFDAGNAGVAASAIRIVSAQPVAVFLRTVGEGGVAMTTGSPVTAARWLLPGAGLTPGATGRMLILNTGLDSATVVVTARRDESVAEQFPVPAGAVVEFPSIEGSADGYTLEGDGSLVPLWVTTTGTASAYSTGVPILDE